MIQKKLIMAAFMVCCGISCNAQTAKHEEQCTADCCKDQKPTSKSGSIDKQVISMETTTKKKVIACKLTSPELQQRKEEVLAALKLKVLDRQELINGYKFKFEGSDSLLDELIVFIKSERACCDFFTFGLSVSDNQSNTWLSITGPDGVKDNFILCKLLGFTPREIAQYYVNQVSFEKFQNKNIPSNIAATSFFMRCAARNKKRK